MKTLVLRSAAALAIVAIAGGAAWAQNNEYPWQQMQQYGFDASAGGTLEVRVDDADVTVLTAEGQPGVTISLRSNDMEWATERFERTNYRARLSGDTIIVESDDEPRGGWERGKWMNVVVEARVPSRFDLDIETNDGDVSAGSFEGSVRLRTQDGDVIVDELRGSDIELRTQDGDVQAAMLAGDTVEVRSQDGDIDVDSITGAVTIHTQDGDIRLGSANSSAIDLGSSDGDIHVGISGSARMQLQTNDGDISIVVPPTVGAEIDFSGDDVYIQGEFDLNGSVSERRARGSINGGGETIRASAGDGTIRLVGRN